MFNSSRQKSKPLHIDTLVGAGTRVVGDLHFQGGLHVDGSIQGNVQSAQAAPALLSVSDSGLIEGMVRVTNLVLNGTVQGDIHVSERVELGATAKVIGNIHYGMIEMAMGAQINGKLIHQANAAPADSAPAAAAELGYTGAKV